MHLPVFPGRAQVFGWNLSYAYMRVESSRRRAPASWYIVVFDYSMRTDITLYDVTQSWVIEPRSAGVVHSSSYCRTLLYFCEETRIVENGEFERAQQMIDVFM